MSKMYRAFLYSGVASAALVVAVSQAPAQTVILQDATNIGAISNPATGTNTIDLGVGGLGIGASVSTSATGAVSATSVVGINTQFLGPFGFGTVTQGATNSGGVGGLATILNNGAITGGNGDVASGASLSIGASGAVASFSILGAAEGAGPFFFNPPQIVGNITQGFSPGNPNASPPVQNFAPVTNIGEITPPTGGPGLALSGAGSSASVGAVGAQGSVSVTALGATTFGGTQFGGISQTQRNDTLATIINVVGPNGVTLGAISGNGASASVTATGAASSVALSYINTLGWLPSSIAGVGQFALNNGIVSNNTNLPGILVGDISGAGASVHAGASGAITSVSISGIASLSAPVVQAATIGNISQFAINTGAVANIGAITSTGAAGLTGPGSSATISATGAGGSVSLSSIGDVANPQFVGVVPGANTVFQTITNTGAAISNQGQIALGTGALANGASAGVSATGAQAGVSVSATNATSFTSPSFGFFNQTASNIAAQDGTLPSVTNTLSGPGITVGNVAGAGAGVSASAIGAVTSASYSVVNAAAWTTIAVGAVQSATSAGAVTNTGAGIQVGSITGAGASVGASAAGAIASISVSTITSTPPSQVLGVTIGGPTQTAINNGPITNNMSIVSTGTLSGIGSSAAITATGAGASLSVSSINDTSGYPTLAQNVTQTATNGSGVNPLSFPVTNTGSITLGGGNLAAGASAAISAAGASASASFRAIK